MKAKLIKEAGGYDLYRVDEDGKRVTFASTQDYKQKLSLKNCQAIERGYDLDELADDFIRCPEDMRTLSEDREINSFKKGFQKALELMGDKKFSINEVVELCKILISNPFETSGKTYQQLTDSYIKSLQQTEWDVEIEMVPALSNNGNAYYGDIPKTDADGCLILKRI